jgi:D-alanyl-D-alanine dipeptidase
VQRPERVPDAGGQLENRLLLKDGLGEQGMQTYENEWRHYTFKPVTYPDPYFDFSVSSLRG